MAKSTATIFLALKKCMIITFILSSAACSNDLSRNKASDIINHFASEKTLGWEICNVNSNRCGITTDLFHPTKKEKEGLFLLERDGFIRVNTPPAESRWLRLTAKAGAVSFADSLRTRRQL